MQVIKRGLIVLRFTINGLSMKLRLALSTFFLLAIAVTLFGQLDTIHWLPPMHARDEWGPQYLYLSTPEVIPFPVNIRDGAGNLLATVTISNALPQRYGGLGSTQSSPTMVTENRLHQPLQAKGLVIDGPKKFYAYYRVHSSSMFHAGDLTCKGRAALGRVFRIGHLLQATDDNDRRANFIGIMATEDSTEIMLSGFDAQTDFRIGGVNTPVIGPVTMTLQKGESAVFSQYITADAGGQPPNGFMGALLEATKPIAVNCGSWVGAPVVFQAHDIGIDQIAPLERVGDEYVLCKGNGSEILERPIVIAHYNNTRIWLNGAANPVATLDAGEYLAVTTDAYSAGGNLYIRSSDPVFVYQMIGGTPEGDDAMRTAGLIFVPPISCGIPNTVDNIYQPNLIGNMRFDGGLMITAMKDSAVTVRIDGVAVPLGASWPVPGNPDFVTYRNLKLFSQSNTPSTVSVVAEGAVQVAMFGRNEPASFAAFYSGFSKVATAEASPDPGGRRRLPGYTLLAEGRFDGVQWMYEDSILHYGPDTMLDTLPDATSLPAISVCAAGRILLPTRSWRLLSRRHFPIRFRSLPASGMPTVKIDFGMPYGGISPYEFSVDNGRHFSKINVSDQLAAGDYKLVVRDSTGCYNRPLALHMGQPDSFPWKWYRACFRIR